MVQTSIFLLVPVKTPYILLLCTENKYTVTAVDIATGFQSNEHKESVGYNMIDGLVSLDEGIRSVIVLEKEGEVVMNYSRDVNGVSVPFEEIGSQTKAIISLIMGKLIEDEDYDLTLDTTLGEIFPDDADWTGASWDVENVEERKTISVSISWYALVGFGVAIPSPNIFFVYSSRFLNYSP